MVSLENDPRVLAAYERICARQQDDITVFKAWALVSKELLRDRHARLGVPGGFDHDEIMALLDAIIGSSDIVNEDRAWELAWQEVQDERDSALDARREFKEA